MYSNEIMVLVKYLGAKPVLGSNSSAKVGVIELFSYRVVELLRAISLPNE